METMLAVERDRRLMFSDWPGKVAESEHTINRAVMFCETSTLAENDIILPGAQTHRSAETFQQAKAKIVEQFERDYIQRLLLSCHGNISKAAQAAHKNRRAFWELIRKHHIDVHRFKLRAS